MNTTITKLLFVFTLLVTFKSYGQETNTESSVQKVYSEDFEILLGDWTGGLTYIDYSSKKPFSMPANLTVTQGKNKNQFVLNFIYPNEPKANSKDKILVSKSGDKLNDKVVKSKRVLSNGNVEIITEYEGKDNNEKALIRNVYLVASNQFVIIKEVKFEKSNDWLKRNEYNFNK